MVRIRIGPKEGILGLHTVPSHLCALIPHGSFMGDRQAGASQPPSNPSGFLPLFFAKPLPYLDILSLRGIDHDHDHEAPA